MDQKVKDAIEEYYVLKNKYESKNNQERRKILQQNKSKMAKKRSLSAFNPTCIACGKVGGTLFRQEKTKLFAVCSAVSPCSLDIEIDRGQYEKITDLYKIVSENYQDSRSDIIKIKLDMLFGYINEEEASAIFFDKKEDFDESNRELQVFDTMFADIFQSKRNASDIAEIKMNIEKIKGTISEFTQAYHEDAGTPSIVSDIVQIYIKELYPEVKKLRSAVYQKNVIECSDGSVGPSMCDDDIQYLVQEPYLYNETEYEIESPLVIKNSK
jgi:hypothetical protein